MAGTRCSIRLALTGLRLPSLAGRHRAGGTTQRHSVSVDSRDSTFDGQGSGPLESLEPANAKHADTTTKNAFHPNTRGEPQPSITALIYAR